MFYAKIWLLSNMFRLNVLSFIYFLNHDSEICRQNIDYKGSAMTSAHSLIPIARLSDIVCDTIMFLLSRNVGELCGISETITSKLN